MNENNNKDKVFKGLLIASIACVILGVGLFIAGAVDLIRYINSQMNNPQMSVPVLTIIGLGGGGFLVSAGIILMIAAIIVKAGKYAMKQGKIYQTEKKMENANRYCPYCGAENDPNAKFCTACGGKLSKEDKRI